MTNIYTWQRKNEMFEGMALKKSELIGIEGINSMEDLCSMSAAMSDLKLVFYLCQFQPSLP
jgi:hypothetical protein